MTGANNNHTYEIVRHGKDGDERLSKDEVLMRVIETGRHYVFNKRTKTSRWVTATTASAIIAPSSSSSPSAAPINKASRLFQQKHHQHHHHHPHRVVNGGSSNSINNNNNNVDGNDIKYEENDEKSITEGISSTSISKDRTPSQTAAAAAAASSFNKHDNGHLPTSSTTTPSLQARPPQTRLHSSEPTTSGATGNNNSGGSVNNNNTGQQPQQYHATNNTNLGMTNEKDNVSTSTNNHNNKNDNSNNDDDNNNSNNNESNNGQGSDEVETKLQLLNSLVEVVEQMTKSGKYKMSDLQQAVDKGVDKDDTKQKLLQLGEFLTQQMLKVDDVESGGNIVVRAKRKQTINFIIALTEQVEQLNAKLKE